MSVWQRLNAPRNKRERRVAKIARDLERERILTLVKGVWESRCSPLMEPDECSVCWLSSSIIKKIEGENE